jgi:GT2 family glycosyltransferase
VVGALLLFADGTIQHSGVVVGMGGWADHVYHAQPATHTGGGPFVSPVLTRNVLAVTGACMAMTRNKFEQIGGFDESFIICGSDVEICVRAMKKGFHNVMCADARLYHFESKTRSSYVPQNDYEQSILKYAPYRVDKTDPYFNPHLSLQFKTPRIEGSPRAS